MITSIPLETIEQQLLRQLSSFFFLSEEDIGLIKFKMKRVISRCEYCFSHTVNKYYSYNGETFLILINLLNILFFSIILPIQYLMKRVINCWQINCTI